MAIRWKELSGMTKIFHLGCAALSCGSEYFIGKPPTTKAEEKCEMHLGRMTVSHFSGFERRN
jgi:hypothetical protein